MRKDNCLEHVDEEKQNLIFLHNTNTFQVSYRLMDSLNKIQNKLNTDLVYWHRASRNVADLIPDWSL